MATFFLNAKRQKNLIVFLFGFLVLILTGTVQAQVQQCNPSAAPGQPLSCQGLLHLPDCFRCIAVVGGPNVCQPQDPLCDDQDLCTLDSCSDNPNGPVGCIHQAQLDLGAVDLPTECYICEPPANNIVFNNGICDEGTTPPETCSNSPEDCGIVGFACGTPTPPLPAPDGPFFPPNTGPLVECIAGIGFGLNAPVTFPTISCEDGDRCTQNICTFAAGNHNTFDPGECSNIPISSCSPISDGCCPTGCTGPAFGQACPLIVIAATSCDPDCWAPQSCGDSEVQPPETCDDSVPSGEAGIRPNGQPVGTAACRDAGDPDECTYCGDGILQPLTEECDGNLLGACGGNGCNTATCQCNTLIDCLEGSGKIGSSTGGPGCDGFSCSLNRGARSSPLGNLLVLGTLASILSLGWLARRRV